MAMYLVELYAARGSDAVAERLTAAVAAAPEVRHLTTILVPTDELGFCLVEAPSAAAVTRLAESAGLRPVRIVEAVADGGGSLA